MKLLKSTIALTFVFVYLSFASPSQAQSVETKIPPALRFATDFIKTLDNFGFEIQKVAYSKFNGGSLGTQKAVWIKTDKGTFEALFYEDKTILDQIQILELPDSTPKYHRYTVTVENKLQQWEGRMPVFFLKHDNLLIISYDPQLNDKLVATFK